MALERANARFVPLDGRAADIPVRYHADDVGPAGAGAFELASHRTIAPLKYPSEETNRLFGGCALMHEAWSYNNDAKRLEARS